jgi:hypothetical protein
MPARDPRDLHRPARLRALPAALRPSPPKEDATAAAAAAAALPGAARPDAALNRTARPAASLAWTAAAAQAHGAKATVVAAHASAARALQGALDATNDRLRGRNASSSRSSSDSGGDGDVRSVGPRGEKRHVPTVRPDPRPQLSPDGEGQGRDEQKAGQVISLHRAAATAKAAKAEQPQGSLDDDEGAAARPAGSSGDGVAGELLETAVEAGAVTGAVALFVWFAGGGSLVGLVLLLRRVCVTRGRSLTRRTHLKAKDEDLA